jgi:hypothetical protein
VKNFDPQIGPCALYDTRGTGIKPDAPGIYGAEISVFIAFDDMAQPDAQCYCCEFRQYVKGTIRDRVTGQAWQIDVDDKDFVEDCSFNRPGTKPPHHCYGHRSGPFKAGNTGRNDYYCSDRECACQYQSHDLPGIPDMYKVIDDMKRLNKKVAIDIALIFRFYVVDYCKEPPLEVRVKELPVNCRGVFPGDVPTRRPLISAYGWDCMRPGPLQQGVVSAIPPGVGSQMRSARP